MFRSQNYAATTSYRTLKDLSFSFFLNSPQKCQCNFGNVNVKTVLTVYELRKEIRQFSI